VKLAQAMGPFNNPLNRRAARVILTGCRHVYARGRITQAHLESLGLAEGQASLAADVAFLYKERFSLSEENEALVRKLEDKLVEIRSRGQRIIGLSPSSLVYEKADKIGHDYVQEFLNLIEHLGESSEVHEFLLLPNATRQGRATTRNNDIYVINEIHANAKRVLPDNLVQRIHSITFDMNTSAIRRFINMCDCLVTSRFHAMVAGLALGVPTLVVSWSHKYSEVLEAFGLEQWELGFDEPGMDLLASTKRLLVERDAIQRQIDAKRDHVLALSSAPFKDLESWLA
jgi:polysaccharide pyruvyl transferase WcaK-like protein